MVIFAMCLKEPVNWEFKISISRMSEVYVISSVSLLKERKPKEVILGLR